MLIFFYGPNVFMIQKAVNQLKDRYHKNVGDLNLVTLEGQDLNPQEFVRQVQAMPLLASSRLIVVKNIFGQKSKDVLDYITNHLESVPESTVVVFTQEGEPDKRLKLFKKLSSEKNSKCFLPLTRPQQMSYIRNELKKLGSTISSEAATELVEFCLDDLWRLDSEIRKLADYVLNEEITLKDIHEIVDHNVLGNSFKFVDALIDNNSKVALDNLHALIDAGEPPLKILGLINYQFRTIACVVEANQKKMSQFEMAKALGVKPFQIQKLLPHAKKTNFTKLSKIYSRLIAIDEAIKSGKISSTDALEIFVLETDGNRDL
jgi:DNA polymerase-3 subunit delta